jgi:hypothetical protein
MISGKARHPLDIFWRSGEIDALGASAPGKKLFGGTTMFAELLTDMAHSTPQGTVGVSLIFIYLAWIITVAFIRIQQGKKEGHH